MENEEEVQAQEEVVEQEEQQQEEVEQETEEQSEEESDTVTLSKAEYNKLNRRAKAYVATKDTKPEKLINNKAEVPNEKLERMELRLDGYSSDEVDEIMSLGGSKVLKSKIVQSAIKAMRDEKKSKDADANFSAKSPVYKKYTNDDLNGMSSAELEKILPKA